MCEYIGGGKTNTTFVSVCCGVVYPRPPKDEKTERFTRHAHGNKNELAWTILIYNYYLLLLYYKKLLLDTHAHGSRRHDGGTNSKIYNMIH